MLVGYNGAMRSDELPDDVMRKAASELARRNALKRWATTTQQERSATARELNEARWKGKSKAAKSAAAKKAAAARWGKKKVRKPAKKKSA